MIGFVWFCFVLFCLWVCLLVVEPGCRGEGRVSPGVILLRVLLQCQKRFVTVFLLCRSVIVPQGRWEGNADVSRRC